jgi:SagB-type dehydrogenase family enzyme
MIRRWHMKNTGLLFILAVFLAVALLWGFQAETTAADGSATVKLPQPVFEGTVSVEKALKERRSVRAYKAEPLAMSDVAQILWAAQGVSEPTKSLRTAPSAKGAYLLEVYLISGNVTGLPAGLYKYQPGKHELARVTEGNVKEKLFAAASQPPIKNAPAVLVIAGYPKKSTNPGWMYLEAGHAAENVYLQAGALGLGTVTMAGFKPDEVRKALSLPEDEQPIYIMPLGKK